jgi:hypothetical protein
VSRFEGSTTDLPQTVIAFSAIVSAVAAGIIARLTSKLVRATKEYVEETKKYRQSADCQLELLRQQWFYQISPQVFIDFRTVPAPLNTNRLDVYCHNYGRPEIFVFEIEMNLIDEGRKGRLFRKDVKHPLMSGQPLHIDVTDEVREGVIKMSRGPLFSRRGDLLPQSEFEDISFSASRDLWVTYYCLGNRHQIRHSGPIRLSRGLWDVSLPEPEF